MRLPNLRRYYRNVPLIIVISGVAAGWAVAVAWAQTRPTPQSPQPQTRPTPAARATPLGRTAPPPLKIHMFQPGNLPPAHPLSSGSEMGPVPQALTVVERQQIFSLQNAPQVSLSLAHMVEPNKAALRVVEPQYVGEGVIKVGALASHQQQSYVCLDLDAEPNKTYFVDMMFETGASGAIWDVYGPDSKTEMDFPGATGKVTHLTFGFVNAAKPGKFLFQMAPRQNSNVYRLDIYVR